MQLGTRTLVTVNWSLILSFFLKAELGSQKKTVTDGRLLATQVTGTRRVWQTHYTQNQWQDRAIFTVSLKQATSAGCTAPSEPGPRSREMLSAARRCHVSNSSPPLQNSINLPPLVLRLLSWHAALPQC